MEVSTGINVNQLEEEGSEQTQSENFDLEMSDFLKRHDHPFHSMNALEILRETIRILRFNSSSFMLIAALIISPVSAVVLSNVLVNQSIVKRLTTRLLLVAKSSGLPLSPFIKHTCYRFAEMIVSSLTYFPLFITLSSLSKAAVAYAVDCTYSKRSVEFSKFLVIMRKIWRRVVLTYLWVCMVIAGVITLFCVLLVVVCSVLSIIESWPDLNLYVAMLIVLVFSVVFANAIIICSIAIVISVLEDVSGLRTLLRARILIRGQTQVGLLIFLGSAIGMAFVEGLFEHRVKTVSYGDGSSRIWEGPLLVIMYSFVVLIHLMMNSVFYFSCKSYSAETADGEHESILESVAASGESVE